MARTHLRFCAAAAALALLLVPACGNDQTASRRVVRSPAPASPVPTFEPPGATPTTPDPDDPSQARISVPRTPSPVPEPASRLAQARVKVTRLGSFTRPLAFTHNGDGQDHDDGDEAHQHAIFDEVGALGACQPHSQPDDGSVQSSH